MARPSNVGMSLKHLGDIVDDIWWYSGDRSPDVSSTVSKEGKGVSLFLLVQLVYKTWIFGCNL